MAFNVRKAAQAVALLVQKQGDNADHIKTMKLVYLADRRFLELYDLPILNDDFCSMEHGPVDSETYDYVKGNGKDRQTWQKYIKARQGNIVRLAHKFGDDDFDELSRAEISVLNEIFERFKDLKPFELVDYVHKNCAEWEDVGKTSKYLPYERVFNALGKKNSNQLTDYVYEIRNLNAAHADAR
jgi:uncharacterized phage-associated protein